ncbi:uncharacterized protein LOC131967755 [Centropristis striata]|uniref:uncharacterized protein LOC131967755 n=1 Tax=Centropristis striata TaxID=184440 RepID=UPI0027E1F7F3|nr:uncharacterized protein LOC131967755 [Centropristis striata]
MKTKNEGECPICDRAFKGVAKHLRTWHKVENMQERAILNQMATGRVNLGSGPCPVPGCLSRFCPQLERHIMSHRSHLTAARLQRVLEAAKRRAAVKRLRDLRATNPNPPLKSTLDVEEEEREEEDGPPGETPLCQLASCQSLRRRVQELEKEVEELRASNAALRAAAGEGPSGLQRPVAPQTTLQATESCSSEAEEEEDAAPPAKVSQQPKKEVKPQPGGAWLWLSRLREDEEALKRGLAEIVSNLSDGDTSEDEEDSSEDEDATKLGPIFGGRSKASKMRKLSFPPSIEKYMEDYRSSIGW